MRRITLLFFLLLLSLTKLTADTVSPEGAWCWFADPRALHYETPDGRINRTFIGYIDIHGNIRAMQYDFNQRRQTEVLIRSYFQPDDHNNPTFLALPDGRIMIFYSRHTDEACFYYRVSQMPGDITTLGREHRLDTPNNTTYPSPFILADDPTHIYLCWRGINWHPTIARLSLPGADDKVNVEWGPYQLVQSTGARPYAKYASDGKGKIYFAYTTGHPDNESPNYLYFNYIDIHTLTLQDVCGRELQHIANGPLQVSKLSNYVENYPATVVDATTYRDWVWQVMPGHEGRPQIAMTRISADKKSHNYYLARWDGHAWTKHHITHAGGHFHQSPDIEHCYSAGMSLDDADPSVVYCSVPVEGRHGLRYEIVRYQTDTRGEIVDSRAITSNSEANNVRPYIIPGSRESALRLAWMRGDYYDWIVSRERPKGYCTSICSDFSGFDFPQQNNETGIDTCYETEVKIDTTRYEGVLARWGQLSYVLDGHTLLPQVRYKNKVYASTNRLATADSWAGNIRSTQGQWFSPVKQTTLHLKMELQGNTLRIYRNGWLDQYIKLPIRHISDLKLSKESLVGTAAQNLDAPFSITQPDYTLSPYTGLTRRHWQEAARHLLRGAFSYIHSVDDCMYFPKQLDKTYPRNEDAVAVAKLEGLCRTLFVAAPLLREDPGLEISGICVADYFRHQIAGMTRPGSTSYVMPRPTGPSQTMLELGALAMSLKVAQNVLWDPLPQAERDALATLLRNYGEGPTIESNWRFFNVFLMSFLKDQGYEVNEEYLRLNLTRLLERYRGEGWYNDSPAYDYYSMWAFQTYGPLWIHYYGNQFPEIAAQFDRNQADLIDNYPYMFARDGRMNMWGRSLPYRFASVSPLPLLEWNNTDAGRVNYGWMRRIASATLMQFMSHPDFLHEGIPTMGFYGLFAPCVQVYSCRGSVYWMGKAFFSLLLPESSKFWSATENEGPWEDELKPGHAYNKFQPATNLLITDYPNSGGAEIRSWCHETVAGDWQKFRSTENYNKLAYHTEFPWMADGKQGEISMNYGIKNQKDEWEVLRLYTFRSFENGQYRRDAVLETDTTVRVQLTDIPLADGVLRVDKVSSRRPLNLRLGSYSLPQLSSPLKVDRQKVKINFAGMDFGRMVTSIEVQTLGNGHYQLTSIPLYGWTETQILQPRGLHPMADECGLLMHEAKIDDSQIFITLHLWKKGNRNFTTDELSVVKQVEVAADKKQAVITLADNTRHTVNFE